MALIHDIRITFDPEMKLGDMQKLIRLAVLEATAPDG